MLLLVLGATYLLINTVDNLGHFRPSIYFLPGIVPKWQHCSELVYFHNLLVDCFRMILGPSDPKLSSKESLYYLAV